MYVMPTAWLCTTAANQNNFTRDTQHSQDENRSFSVCSHRLQHETNSIKKHTHTNTVVHRPLLPPLLGLLTLGTVALGGFGVGATAATAIVAATGGREACVSTKVHFVGNHG